MTAPVATKLERREMRRLKNLCRYLFALGVLLFGLGPALASANDNQQPFRLAMSSSMFSAVKESDARAAMKVWIMTVAKERGLAVDPDPHIQDSVMALTAFGLENPVDGFGLTTPELPYLSERIKLDRFAVGVRDEKFTEEYILLVRRDSGLEHLEQLRGRRLKVLNNPRTSLALIWLDILLQEAQLGCAYDFFGDISLNNKTDQVALPVFFGQTEACLITRASFQVMGELNPQLKLQLRILAVSPELVPTGFAFRENNASQVESQILEAMEQLGDSPAGRQILALTQADRIEAHPLSCLNESLELLAKHRQACSNCQQYIANVNHSALANPTGAQ